MKKLILTLALFTQIAHAGNERGNGGDAIVCTNRDGSLKSVEFFDLYEAKERYKFTLVPSEAGSLEEKVEELISRIEPHNPSRAKKYRGWAATFIAESDFLVDKELTDIPDTGMAYFPRGCTLGQAVIQQEPQVAAEKRYIINKDYWDVMDLNNRAALIVHELILRETAYEFGHNTSWAARYLHALIESDRLKTYSLVEYVTELRKIKFKTFDYSTLGMTLTMDDQTKFHETGIPASAVIVEGASFSLKNTEIAIDCKSRKEPCGSVTLDEAGRIRSIDSASIVSLVNTRGSRVVTAEFPDSVNFREDGRLIGVQASFTGNVTLNAPKVSASGRLWVVFGLDENLYFLRFNKGENGKVLATGKTLLNGQWFDFWTISFGNGDSVNEFQPHLKRDVALTVGRNTFLLREYTKINLNNDVVVGLSTTDWSGLVLVGARKVPVRSEVKFYENGEVKEATIGYQLFLPVIGEKKEKRICEGSTVQFDQSGLITNFSERMNCSRGILDIFH